MVVFPEVERQDGNEQPKPEKEQEIGGKKRNITPCEQTHSNTTKGSRSGGCIIKPPQLPNNINMNMLIGRLELFQETGIVL